MKNVNRKLHFPMACSTVPSRSCRSRLPSVASGAKATSPAKQTTGDSRLLMLASNPVGYTTHLKSDYTSTPARRSPRENAEIGLFLRVIDLINQVLIENHKK